MESQMFNQWVQTQIPEASQQHSVLPQHEAASRGSDDWPKDRSQNVGNLPIQSTSLGSQIDLNEFTSLGDLPGELFMATSQYVTNLIDTFSFRSIRFVSVLQPLSCFKLSTALSIQRNSLWFSMVNFTYPYPSVDLLQS